MNVQEFDLVKMLSEKKYTTQREMAEIMGCSLGKINLSIRNLMEQGYLSENKELTRKAREELRYKKPGNAIILAAWSYVKKKYKLNMPFLVLSYPAKASALLSNAA